MKELKCESKLLLAKLIGSHRVHRDPGSLSLGENLPGDPVAFNPSRAVLVPTPAGSTPTPWLNPSIGAVVESNTSALPDQDISR